MSKFKAIHTVTENNLESVVNETERPWDWFPELEKFCTSNFFIGKMVFDLDLSKQEGLRETVQRISFKIEKIEDHPDKEEADLQNEKYRKEIF